MTENQSNKKIFLAFYFILTNLFISNYAFAQTKTDSLKLKYPFLKTELNYIKNDTLGLDKFYLALKKLNSGNNATVNVAHIGDSHLQADFVTTKVRKNLQLKYGNAGRGLVFPYKLAKTNEPGTYGTQSKSLWESKRIVQSSANPLTTGLAGITIKTNDSVADLFFQIHSKEAFDYSFNQIKLIHEKGLTTYDLIVKDENDNIRGFVNANLRSDNKFLSNIILDTALTKFKLNAYKRDSSLQRSVQLYGMVLSNGKPGILYSMIGINGAEFRHYNKSEHFLEQLPILTPQLIIISLGTNDAYPPKFDANSFIRQIDSLITFITIKCPETSILLTTPGDSYRHKKIKNPNMPIAGNIIKEYCRDNKLAYWDWLEIMGGYGSMAKWVKTGLGQGDKLHLTRAGYEVEGELLYQALVTGFENYLKRNP